MYARWNIKKFEIKLIRKDVKEIRELRAIFTGMESFIVDMSC